MSSGLDLPIIDERDSMRFRVSPSKIRTFMEDQAQYYFRYVENRRGETSPALFEGSTYHRGVEYALDIKKNQGNLPPLTQTLTFLEKYWNENHPESINGMVVDKDRFIYIATMFEELYPVLETITPKFIETKVTRAVEEGDYDIHGYVDCVSTTAPGSEAFSATTDKIIDFKSRAQSPVTINGKPSLTSFEKMQLTLYAWCLSKGTDPVEAEIIYLVKTKKPKIVRVPTVVTPEQMINKVNTVNGIVEAMRTGVYLPNYGHWKCRPDRCEFYEECHAKF